MDVNMWLGIPLMANAEMTLAEVNKRLAVGGLSISSSDVEMLAERGAEALANTERVEFGMPAMVILAEAVATSPYLSQDDIAHDLAELLDAFYALRDELPADIPDAEIAEALRGCLDTWGSAAEVASLRVEEVMRFSEEHMLGLDAERNSEYRIVDEEGRAYAFDPAEWVYDEQAGGWDGEGWADDWDD